tara:strand:+ start:2203 stop:2655 length:453 start_codon:yes stop_codon:yes gene_type:complete
MIAIGDKIPDFELTNIDREKMKSEDFLGEKTMFVFMPFPFSGVCTPEVCDLRDNKELLDKASMNTVIITISGVATNITWASQYNIEFPILSDFWPHGEVSQMFGCFNEKVGTAMRYSYITNEDNIVTDIVKSDELPVGREMEQYKESLGS